jgi:hypothetical protein
MSRGRDSDPYTLFDLLMESDFSSVSEARRALRSGPDVRTRASALGALVHREQRDAEDEQLIGSEIEWFVTNRPNDMICRHPIFVMVDNKQQGDRLGPLWEAHREGTSLNADGLQHYSLFFQVRDWPKAEQALEEAVKLDPALSTEVPRMHLRLAKFSRERQADRARHARLCLRHLGNLGNEPDEKLEALDQSLLRMAVEAAGIASDPQAARLASVLLRRAESEQDDVWAGQSRHVACTLLGLVALANDDVEGAIGWLERSAAVGSSPKLLSYGPDLALARMLLSEGEDLTVMSFLDASRSFWLAGHKRLDHWIDAISRGAVPDWDQRDAS